MSPLPRNWHEWRTVILGPIITVVLVVTSLTAIGNVQANQYRRIVDKLDFQERTIICILEIVPDERTPALIDQCVTNPII